jgi:glycosyltransferase involved in cell wall biosynthesis
MEALYSLVMQNYPQLEVMIVYHVDDVAALALTKEVVSHFQEYFPIKEYQLPKSGTNRSQQMNLALTDIDGEFVSFLDDDDIYYPEFSHKLIKYLQLNPTVNFAYGDFTEVQIQKLPEFVYIEKKKRREQGEFNKLRLLLDNYLPIHTFVIRTALLGKTKFDEQLDLMEDWAFLIELTKRGGFNPVYLPMSVAEYRKVTDKTNTGFNSDSESTWLQTKEFIRQNKIFNSEQIHITGKDLETFTRYFEPIFSASNNFAVEKKTFAFRLIDKLRKLPLPFRSK